MECALKTGDLLRLAGGSQGMRLHCLRGTIWLTKGDGVDYLVRQGQSFNLTCRDAAVVEALGSAELRLEPGASGRAGASPVLTLAACRL